MSDNQIALSSMALDLKRAAIGYWNGSTLTAERFYQEALKREKEIDKKSIQPYVLKVLKRIEKLGSQKDIKKIAEDALMYSTLLQNAALV